MYDMGCPSSAKAEFFLHKCTVHSGDTHVAK